MVRRVFVFVDRYQRRKFPVTIGIIVSIEAAVNLAVPLKVKGVPRPPVNFRLIFSLIRYRYSLASRCVLLPNLLRSLCPLSPFLFFVLERFIRRGYSSFYDQVRGSSFQLGEFFFGNERRRSAGSFQLSFL